MGDRPDHNVGHTNAIGAVTHPGPKPARGNAERQNVSHGNHGNHGNGGHLY